jgi:hypothetical protein
MKVNFFDTPSGPGAWASFTDRSLVGRPIPEGQKLISTTGLRSWKGAFLMFTLLSNSVETSSFRQAMNVVQAGITLATTPTSTPDAASRAGAGSGGARRDAVVVSELPTEFKVTVPVSRLVMHIPKGRLHPAKSTLESGSTVSRRYFMLSDQEGLVVSGWFEPQEEFPGLEKYWDQKMAVWSELPKPQRVSFGKTGKWNTVTWFVPSPAGSSANISAHWVEAGTWIDVHLSILSKAPEAEAVAKLALLLAQIEVAANSQ